MVFCCINDHYEDELESSFPNEDRSGKNGSTKPLETGRRACVVVPKNVEPGHTLLVYSPDRLQTIQAIVPQDCQPGDSFYVRFPARDLSNLGDSDAAPGFVGHLDKILTPEPSLPEVTASHYIAERSEEGQDETRIGSNFANGEDSSFLRESPDTIPRDMDCDGALIDLDDVAEGLEQTGEPSGALMRSPSAGALLGEFQPHSPRDEDQDYSSMEELEQKVILIRVPMGMPSGSIIHVEIPGENRTVAATVPENVRSFHVCYTPRPQPMLVPPYAGQRSLRTHAAPRPEDSLAETTRRQLLHQHGKQAMGTPASYTRAGVTPLSAMTPPVARQVVAATPPRSQKLLLVRVPPGTQGGTTIHVSVPDEPGRILAAVVPQGGVREFHISYESRAPVVSEEPARPLVPPVSGGALQSGQIATRGSGGGGVREQQEPPAAYQSPAGIGVRQNDKPMSRLDYYRASNRKEDYEYKDDDFDDDLDTGMATF